jgi:hypothetical protein
LTDLLTNLIYESVSNGSLHSNQLTEFWGQRLASRATTRAGESLRQRTKLLSVSPAIKRMLFLPMSMLIVRHL